LAACAGRGDRLGADVAREDVLYFGTARPHGVIGVAEWETFAREVITPRFPQGLTVWKAQGQWRGETGAIVREDSYVLTLIHPGTPETERAIKEIIELYKSRFEQESVMRVESAVRVSF
ncbi:MAG: DUF3574 domain-containing protein, partial [Deltaproteobacteria bacterium]|nr:DUF3574 domain-containing protein [Deltaproteobacteria bacterium]